MFLPLLYEAIFFFGIFGIPTLFFVMLARSGRKFILFNLGLLLILIGFIFFNNVSWRFALLYLILGGMGVAHASYGWPGGNYGLYWAGFSSVFLGISGGIVFGILFLMITGSLCPRLTFFVSHSAFLPLLANLFASLIPGIWEEFVFRGVIQEELNNLLHCPGLTVVIIAAIFTLFHSDRLQNLKNTKIGWIYLSFIFVGACFMGWLKEKYGLLSAIACHTLYNFLV